MKKIVAFGFAFVMSCSAAAVAEEPADTVEQLNEVTVRARRGIRKMSGATNTDLISASELTRAACCNLGESFSTNPSVDVNYNDAATGARQIRLLGLSGQYVQFLTENIPYFRGAAAPYALGYVAGPWMQSIQVSKGASSVKNGYESITGQINVEMKKPQADPQLAVNMYYDSMNKFEANVDGNWNFGSGWSAGLLTHFENAFTAHDSNDDGFADMPQTRQFAIMPRLAYLGSSYVFQAAARYIDERRRGGQISHHGGSTMANPYLINIDTRRWEAFTKNAYIFDRDNDGNIALILSGSGHDMNAGYGLRICDILEHNFYGSLMFERKWNELHALSAGFQTNYDHFVYHTRLDPSGEQALSRRSEQEFVSGAYAQYTFNLDDRLIAMAGLRYDYSNRYGSLVTPRLHVRYNPVKALSLHVSAGKGSRAPHPLAEYSYLLASSRRMVISDDLRRESAWNYGAGATWEFRPWGKRTTLSAEYYYTRFSNQLLANLDRDPHAVFLYSTSSRSFSHSLQLELTVEPISDLTVTGAWRYTDVRADYLGNGLMQRPLTPTHKGLVTIGYAPMMGIWQFDVSCAFNGGGRMPLPASDLWASRYKGYVQLNAQATRNFRNWAIYIGGENLTNYRQRNPIVGASHPWGPDFDATMVYGPLQGAMAYIGFRFNITKYI